jgi:hypothetical protein
MSIFFEFYMYIYIYIYIVLFLTANVENTQRCYEIYSVSSPVCVLAVCVKELGGRDFVCDLKNFFFPLYSINYSKVLL